MELLTTEQAAEFLGWKRNAVLKMARAGRLVGHKISEPRRGGGNKWRFTVENLQAFEIGHRRLVLTTPITASHDEIVWFAGFFDGEGCICISRQSDRSAGWGLLAVLPNASLSTVRSLPPLFGGSCLPVKRATHQSMDQLRWRVCSRQAALVLQTLLPYLRVKRRQAILAIEFQARMDAGNHNSRRPIPAEELEWREYARERMSWLNHNYE